MIRSGMFLIFFLSSTATFAQGSCPWVPTLGKTPDEVAKLVEEKSGKKPTKACGGGTDFKVCHECSAKLSPEQWRRVQWMLAEPAYRDWHFHWHQNSVTDARTKAKELGKSENELQGESFFYAHREFYRNVQANLAAMGLPCISPWSKAPATMDDPNFETIESVLKKQALPVCAKLDPGGQKLKQLQAFENERPSAEREVNEFARNRMAEVRALTSPTERMKADRKAQQEIADARAKARALMTNKPPTMTPQEEDALRRCLDRGAVRDFRRSHEDMVLHGTNEFLAKNSLGQLGHAIDGSWHGPLHNLYETRQAPDCDEENIAPHCDSMGDAISSHVNMNFYKLHGLVDEYAEKWMARRGFEIASKNCEGKEKCFQWTGSYVGESPDFVNGSGCTMVHGPNGVVAANRDRARPSKSSTQPSRGTQKTKQAK